LTSQAVLALRQMRAVSASIYGQDSWRVAVKVGYSFLKPQSHSKSPQQKSGLAYMIEIICDPATKLELSEPHISLSYRNYCWKESLGEVLERWTPKDMIDEMDNMEDNLPSVEVRP